MDEYSDYDTAAQLLAAPEVTAAVDWWATALCGKPDHDAGDPTINSLTNFVAEKMWSPLEHQQVQEFKRCLRIGIVCLCQPSWKDALANPRFGSATRVVATDYGPDSILNTALSAAWISSGGLRLPIKTVMWINPGKVEVANGYGAKATTIYERGHRLEPQEAP